MNEWARNYEFLEDGPHGYLFFSNPKRAFFGWVAQQFAKLCTIPIPKSQPTEPGENISAATVIMYAAEAFDDLCKLLNDMLGWFRPWQSGLQRRWAKERAQFDAAQLRHRWKTYKLVHRPYKPPWLGNERKRG